MRKSLIALSIVIVMLFGVALAAAHAQDVELQVTVKSVTAFTDKNGNPCIRIIVDEERTLKGFVYTAGVPVMAFRDMTAQVKGIEAGDSLHVIAAERFFQGRKSYTILAVLK
ncbi:unnamed protein product [marine sediment metagenome]|uniref:Uncharacterized protein n=1 Tax=marine sediment metagenome TaxID=412755 RepID=X1AC78_9ZZZZ